MKIYYKFNEHKTRQDILIFKVKLFGEKERKREETKSD